MKYVIGQTVYWSGGWGEQPEELAKVIGIGSKNGMVVYDLDNGHWAYEYQLRVCEEEVEPSKDLSKIRTKEAARQYAIEWQAWQSGQSLAWSELMEWHEVFRKLGRKFKLTEEFEENGL